MTAYKVFYDKESKKFKYDAAPREYEREEELLPDYEDETTYWCRSGLDGVENFVYLYNHLFLKNIHICKDCQNPFWITDDKRHWYEERGLAVPARCMRCIDKRKGVGK